MSKRVAVTGAFGALGSVVSSHLASVGYRVCAIDLGQEPVMPKGVMAIGGFDLADPVAAERAFERLRDEGIPLAGLVNIAGGFAWEPILEGSIDTWDHMYGTNLRTVVNACRASVPLMAAGSAVISIGALGAINPGAGMGAYAASKSGVARLTESLAVELRAKRIRVNALLPSIIDTPANRREMPDANFGDWVKPQELAEIIEFFLSDAASAITGALLPVSGR